IPPGMPLAAHSRNNRMLLAALEQIADDVAEIVRRHGPHRVGIVLGTSTSGVAEGEAAIAEYVRSGSLPADFDYGQMEIGAPAPFLAEVLGIYGPAYTVSTACTSGAKALASARNLLATGLVDAVIAGGVDTLCRLTLNGFTALESTTAALTNPLSRNRQGINIGEGAALFIVSRDDGPVEMLGVGESSDAYHMSAPEPEGRGAETAIRAALTQAALLPAAIGYVNLHATATPKNDAMECLSLHRIFPEGVPVSGTKPLTGHTLGAAGAIEAAFCWLALTGDGHLPPHVWDGEFDPELPRLHVVQAEQHFPEGKPEICMSNSFAFGGNNISLIFGKSA
ncbi:MAG TPA: beta-ketoacyl-ACP synthase, partial [Rhodocyclaceae bacterium]|nr:beta-ketoacyl-ACP synthase [Rhodocyclaceae bacterium]